MYEGVPDYDQEDENEVDQFRAIGGGWGSLWNQQCFVRYTSKYLMRGYDYSFDNDTRYILVYVCVEYFCPWYNWVGLGCSRGRGNKDNIG